MANTRRRPSDEFDDWSDIIVESLDDLERDEPQLDPPVFHELMELRDVFTIVAPAKLGKSYFSLQMAVSHVANKEWFGFQPNPDVARDVLIVDNELKKNQIYTRLKRVCRAMGVDYELARKHIKVVSMRGKRRHVRGMSAWAGALEFRPAILVLDSLYKAIDSEMDGQELAAAFDVLTDVAKTLNAVVVTFHHTTKGPQHEKSAIDAASGSGVIGRSVDGQIVVRESRQGPGFYVMEAALRNYKSVDPFTIKRDFPLYVKTDVPPGLRDPKTKPLPTVEHVREIFEANENAPMTRDELQQKLIENVNCAVNKAGSLVKELMESRTLVANPPKARKYTLTFDFDQAI